MISCTEFILAYNELFSFLDRKYGRAEVDRLWEFLFEPTGKGIPLIEFAKRDGLKGCIDYWTGTLTEEAADVSWVYNLEDGWWYGTANYCPSKGRLLEYQKTLGIEPYPDYCDHCDYYRASLEKVGLTWIRNHLDVNKASCSKLLYDPKVFNGVMRMNENTVFKEIRAEEHEYFHPDFHSSMNMGIQFLGLFHSEEDIQAYLRCFTLTVYKPVLKAMEQDPLGTLADKIRETYAAEKAADALDLRLSSAQLEVHVAYCPAVKHLRATGRDVSPWFHMTTTAVMETLSEAAGLQFTMDSYDPETGRAAYRFCKNRRNTG